MFEAAFVIILAIFFFLPRMTSAQEPTEAQHQEDLQAFAKATKDSIEQIRPALFGNLAGRELSIYNEIEFRVSNNDSVSRAWSAPENGQRIIVIDVGYMRQIYNLAEAYAIEQAANKDVVIPYIDYVMESWRDHASFVKTPPDFAHFDFDKILDDPNRSAAFGRVNLAALAFIMAHEVGHHVLGHIDLKPYPTDKATLREMEISADAWAVKRLENAKPHFSPLGGFLPLVFNYYISSSPMAAEHSSDHPADLRRITAVFQAMMDSLPTYKEDIEKQGKSLGITYEDFKRFIEEQLESFERQMETDSPPVMPYLPEESKGPFSQPIARSAPSQRSGAYCGDVNGRRYCAMSLAAPIGTRCSCPGVPGWGVTVP
jgi:hypothetical protein